MRQEIILSLLCGGICLIALNGVALGGRPINGLHVKRNYWQKDIKQMEEDIRHEGCITL